MKKIDIENSKIQSPFQVPDDYFEKLEVSIQQRVRGDREQSVFLPVLKWATVPALLVIFFIGYLLVPTNNQANSDEMIAQLSSTEILDYLEMTDITEYDIASFSDSPESLLDGEEMLENIDLNESDLNNILDQFDLDINIDEI